MSVDKEIHQDQQDLQAIREGQQQVLRRLYEHHRKAFLAWSIQHYHCEEQEAVEVYQKAFTIVYLNIRNGKLQSLSSSLKTYLFSVGKNVFREQYRAKANQALALEDNEPQIPSVENQVLANYQAEHQKALVSRLLERIGEPCKTLLELSYIKGYAVEAIVEAMGYSDERVVRKRKSICLKQLRNLASEYQDFP